MEAAAEANLKVIPTKPHFFKPLLPGFRQGLLIPVAFYKHYLNDHGKSENRDAVLRTVLGQWKVKIKDGRFEEDGWRDFVEHHDLQVAHMLVFRYEGEMVFDVMVFDLSACERCYEDDDHQSVPLDVKQEVSLQKCTDDMQPFLISRKYQLLTEQVQTTEEGQIKLCREEHVQANKEERELSGDKDGRITEELLNKGQAEEDTKSTQEEDEASADKTVRDLHQNPTTMDGGEANVQDENTGDVQKVPEEGENQERPHANFPLPSQQGWLNPRRKRLMYSEEEIPKEQPQPKGTTKRKAPPIKTSKKASLEREKGKAVPWGAIPFCNTEESVGLAVFLEERVDSYRGKYKTNPKVVESIRREYAEMDEAMVANYEKVARRIMKAKEKLVEESEDEGVDQFKAVQRKQKRRKAHDLPTKQSPKTTTDTNDNVFQPGGPMNAFIRFKNDRLEYYKEVNPGMKMTKDVWDSIGQEWTSMTGEQKAPYLEGAALEKKHRKQLRDLGLLDPPQKKKEKVVSITEDIGSRKRTQSCMSLPSIIDFYAEMSHEQKKWMYEIGLGGLEHLKLTKTIEDFNAFIYDAYDPAGHWVRAHDRHFQITDAVVGWLFDISYEGTILEEEPNTIPNQKAAHRLGLTKSFVGVSAYGDWFKVEANNKLTDDWKQRAVIYVLACFGMPVARLGVRQTLVKYVMDLEKLKGVNWAGTWLRHLYDQQKPVKEKRNIRGAGCLLIPMLVYLEHFSPKFHDNPDGCQNLEATPRLKFWDYEAVRDRWNYIQDNLPNMELKWVDTCSREPAIYEVIMKAVSSFKVSMVEIVDRLVVEKMSKYKGVDELVNEEEPVNDEEGQNAPEEVSIKVEVTSPTKPMNQDPIQVSSRLTASSDPGVQVASNKTIKRFGHFEVQEYSKMPKGKQVSGQKKGVYDAYLPEMPSVDQCKLHLFMSRMMEPGMDTDPTIAARWNTHPLIVMKPESAELTREFGWQLLDGEWFGDQVMDCFSMLLHLEGQNRADNRKKTWFFGSLYSALNQYNVDFVYDWYTGDWDQMDTIAVPLNVKNRHYFLMVLSFEDKRVFILDSKAGSGYGLPEVNQKLEFLHQCLNASFPDRYAKEHNITKWPVVWTHPDLPKQRNGYDCGAYVCFYMEYLRELIPTPKRRIHVMEPYLRVWVAHRIATSLHNQFREGFVDAFREFKKDPLCDIEVSKIYKHIPSVHAEYKGQKFK